MTYAREAPAAITKKLVAFLETQPSGADVKTCAEAVGLKRDTCRRYMYLADEIVCVEASYNTRWCLHHQVDAAKAYQAQKKLEYWARWNKRPHLTGNGPIVESAKDWEPRQLWLDARTAPPIQKIGPASVWELAA